MANVPLPYSIEYAKSARSTCKKCKNSIPAEKLRMSINHPATFFDGNIDSWYHYECFWRKLVRGQDQINISSIRGVDWIRWEDQEDLRDRIQKFKESLPALPLRALLKELYLHEVKLEKSATNRGKCAKCTTNFQKGEIKVIYKSKSIHFKCHIIDFDKISGKLEDIPGWSEVDDNWKVAVAKDFDEIMMTKQKEEPKQPEKEDNAFNQASLEMFPSSSAKNETVSSSSFTPVENVLEHAKKSSAEDEGSSSFVGKNEEESEFQRKRRLGKGARLAIIQERKMKKQTDELCNNLQIFNSMSLADRLVVLKENGQDVPEGHDQNTQIVERLSDYALFGCPIHCVKCFNGTIVYNSSRRIYACAGYASEYTKCTYETKNPTRTPFILPKYLYEKYKLHKAVFNLMSERLYREGEDSEEIVKTDKRKSKGGVHGDQFVYAAEQIDFAQAGTINKLTDAKANTTHIIKNGTLVDAKFALAGQCHVFKNEVNGTIYQTTLSLTDLTQNKNSYYKIQLLKKDVSEHYYLFRSWGRVGTDVGDSTYNEYNKEDGIAKFEELFYEKTGNEWRYRKHFRKMPGRFNQVETDYSEIAELGEQDVVPGSKTRLPQPVKEVLMSIFDIENMKTALKSFEMDINKMPLGRLSRNQINQAFSVLNDISDLLIELPIRKEKLLDASNKFYTIIPHNFGMKVPEPIDSLHKVKVRKNNMLNALLDIKFAYDQICGDNPKRGIAGVDPVDANYEKLKCIMTPLQRDCEDWNNISEYLNNTQGSTHDMKVDLVDILKLDRADESTKFKKTIGNRRLLWHGSGKMNFAGILGQGLRIAPPEAPVSGYMFGKGVYFADMFSKSFFYCRANVREEAYLLLCDVALGEMTTCMQATTYSKKTLPKTSHSVKGIGRECPMESGNYVHPEGYIIPKGKVHFQLQGARNRDFFLLYNE
uniref:Poly [ADP-ribose] polymerase n=1 Tax=Caenorhabditis tropicalis TaxID=1561998 RepID=A0A1I7TKS2_9PELO